MQIKLSYIKISLKRILNWESIAFSTDISLSLSFCLISFSFFEIYHGNIAFNENKFNICKVFREEKELEFLMASQNNYPHKTASFNLENDHSIISYCHLFSMPPYGKAVLIQFHKCAEQMCIVQYLPAIPRTESGNFM